VNPRALLPAGILVSVTLAYGALASFIAPHGLKIGPGKTAAAWSWGVYALVLFVLQLRAGRLADRYSCLTSVGLGLVLVGLALTIRRVGSDGRGAGVATFTAGFDVGISVGSIVFGLLAEAVGYRTMFVFAGFALLTGFALVLLRLRRTRWQPRG